MTWLNWATIFMALIAIGLALDAIRLNRRTKRTMERVEKMRAERLSMGTCEEGFTFEYDEHSYTAICPKRKGHDGPHHSSISIRLPKETE